MVFDYVAAAKRAGIGPEELDQLVALTRAEFPRDEMMVELHVLRTLQAVERRDVSLSDVLRPRAAA